MGAVITTLMFAAGLGAMVTGINLDSAEKRCGRKAVYGKLGFAGGALACILAICLILFEL